MSVTERLNAALSDRYRIERELGQGGMATVYLAEDVKHKRKVALETLRDKLDRETQLGVEEAVRMTSEIADALHYAHGQGRDPPGHQAGEHPAGQRPADGGRLRDRAGGERRGGRAHDGDGPEPGDAALHVARAGHSGRELFYRSGDAFMSVEVTPGTTLTFGSPRPLFPDSRYRSAPNRQEYDVAHDGQHFVFIRDLPRNTSELVYVENWLPELLAKVKR